MRIALAAFLILLSCSAPPSASGPAQVVNPGPASSACSFFDVPLQASTQWSYAIRWKGGVHALETISVEGIDGSTVTLLTILSMPEERIHWSTSVDCSSRQILHQDAPDFAYVFWPFPGVFEGQRIDEPGTASAEFFIPPRRQGSKPLPVTLSYRIRPGDTRSSLHITRENDHGVAAEIDVERTVGPLTVRYAGDSSAELIGKAESEAVQAMLEAAQDEEEGTSAGDLLASPNATDPPEPIPGAGGADYSNYCDLIAFDTYNSHWPVVAPFFTTQTGSISKGSALSDGDIALLHDDRDSEFSMVLDDQALSHTLLAPLQGVQIAMELESVVWFPKHPQPLFDPDSANPAAPTNYQDPQPGPYTANHFAGLRDISYQSPVPLDRISVRGNVIVDCGHDPVAEIHPATAFAWRHQFGPGIADYYLRAASYSWYPHVVSFFGPNGDKGPFEADFDIPDAGSAAPDAGVYLGTIVPDYSYAGYSVSDDANTDQGIYEAGHAAGHLFGGDPNQPMSTYFDINVTKVGNSQVHISVAPNPAHQGIADPPRPALIGFHFMACVPLFVNGVDQNGCVVAPGVEPSNEYVGQLLPAPLGGIVTGWFYDRHRPNDPLTVEVRGFASGCDIRPGQFVLGTFTTNPPDHTFSFQMPTGPVYACPPSGPGGFQPQTPLDSVVFRTYARDERPEPASTDLFSYLLPNLCVTSAEIGAIGGSCQKGTGYSTTDSGDGYVYCGIPGQTPLVPFCKPNLTGQPVLPGATTGVAVTGGATQLTVSWTPVAEAIGYDVYQVSGSTFTKVAFAYARNSIVFGGLANGLAQTYSVAAVNSVGEGPRSAPVTGTSLHCSQVCGGCCTGEVCSGPASSPNSGCAAGGQACAAACPPTTDVCSNNFCACHQNLSSVCFGPQSGNTEANRTCGNFVNACGGTVSCGTCTGQSTCTGGLNAHCVCNPTPQATACAGRCAVTASDGCGGSYACGCSAGNTCQGGVCQAAPPPPPPTCKNCFTP